MQWVGLTIIEGEQLIDKLAMVVDQASAMLSCHVPFTSISDVVVGPCNIV